MPQGLQTFNEDGVPLIDTGTNVAFILGTLVVSTGGTITDDRFLEGTPFAVVSPLNGGVFIIALNPTFSGNQMTYPGAVLGATYRLIYGIR